MDLSKEMERLNKIQDKKAAALDPTRKIRKVGVSSELTELERIQRAKEKARRNFVNEVVKAKDAALKEEVPDYQRMLDSMPITRKGIEQAKEVFSTYNSRKAYLEAELYLLEKKHEAAERDIDILNNAADNMTAFNNAVMNYAHNCIKDEEEFDIDEVMALWETIVTPEDIAALNRGTTTFDSLNYILGMVKKEFDVNTVEAQDELEEKVGRLFERYGI